MGRTCKQGPVRGSGQCSVETGARNINRERSGTSQGAKRRSHTIGRPLLRSASPLELSRGLCVPAVSTTPTTNRHADRPNNFSRFWVVPRCSLSTSLSSRSWLASASSAFEIALKIKKRMRCGSRWTRTSTCGFSRTLLDIFNKWFQTRDGAVRICVSLAIDPEINCKSSLCVSVSVSVCVCVCVCVLV